MWGAQADALCGVENGSRTPTRCHQRNGYRNRAWDTRVGTLELAIPKLRQGRYVPDRLLEPRSRAERALFSVVAEGYVLGASTRRAERLAQTLRIRSLSKSRVSEMTRELDEVVEPLFRRLRGLFHGGCISNRP